MSHEAGEEGLASGPFFQVDFECPPPFKGAQGKMQQNGRLYEPDDQAAQSKDSLSKGPARNGRA